MRRRRLVLLAAVPSLLSSIAHAADSYSWVPTDGGTHNWTDASNWTGGTTFSFPHVIGDTAVIQSPTTTDLNVALPVAVTIGNLQFGNPAHVQLTDIGNANSGAGTLVFDTGANSATITSGGVAGAINTISAPIQLNTNLAIGSTSTNSLNITGPINNHATGD